MEEKGEADTHSGGGRGGRKEGGRRKEEKEGDAVIFKTRTHHLGEWWEILYNTVMLLYCTAVILD